VVAGELALASASAARPCGAARAARVALDVSRIQGFLKLKEKK
jgi:hypothetical protein